MATERSNYDLEKFAGCRILVIGEAVLDRYLLGETDRISPEAPIPILHVRTHDERPGNAAFVCANLAAMSAKAVLLSVIGSDHAGRRLRKLMIDAGVEVHALIEDRSRPTILKERLMGSVQSAQRATQQLLRVDHEDTSPVNAAIERRLHEHLQAELDQADGVLICDIGKGLLAPGLLRSVLDGAAQRGVPVIVDPCRADDYTIYRGATALTPNRYETERATGLDLTEAESWASAARILIQKCELSACLITLDRDGVFVSAREGSGAHVPTRPREVYDVTGAGDVVLTMFGLAVINGLNLLQGAKIANIAAGLEVTRQGAAVIARADLSLALRDSPHARIRKVLPMEHLLTDLHRHRETGRRICLVCGSFFPLGAGHIDLFERARADGDLVVVAIESNPSNGLSVSIRDHIRILAALEMVDYVFAAAANEMPGVINQLSPEILLRETEEWVRNGAINVD